MTKHDRQITAEDIESYLREQRESFERQILARHTGEPLSVADIQFIDRCIERERLRALPLIGRPTAP